MNFREIKERAKNLFKLNYWYCVIISFLVGLNGSRGVSYVRSFESIFSKPDSGNDYRELITPEKMAVILAVVGAIVLTSTMISIVVYAIRLFAIEPLTVSGSKFFLTNIYQKGDLNLVGHGYTENYKNVVKVLFFRDMYVLLWSLLLLIPGIVKSYEYFAVSYLLAEDPNIDKDEAFRLSKEITRGHKFNLFLFDLSFIGWYLLLFFTCGLILPFWTVPYHRQALACYYDELTRGRRNQGYDQGMNQGYDQGMNQGYDQGMNQGYDQGMNQGTNYGYPQDKDNE